MRALLCHCREHLEAPNERALVEVVKKHLMLGHPTLVPSREQAREIVPSLRVARTGTVKGKWTGPWGAPEDPVLEVRLEDGRRRLFWSNELEGGTQRA